MLGFFDRRARGRTLSTWTPISLKSIIEYIARRTAPLDAEARAVEQLLLREQRASGAGLRRLYTESTMRSSAFRCGRGRSPPLNAARAPHLRRRG